MSAYELNYTEYSCYQCGHRSHLHSTCFNCGIQMKPTGYAVTQSGRRYKIKLWKQENANKI
jgi:hypothetical protein